ncbi:MAG: rhamnulokinase family protein [Prevotella sp.]|nr:rhamnulokinase family protein [Prevotella sp.]
MEQPKHFFAVDLGATSGRTIIGTIENGKMSLEELTRFDNNLIETGGHFYWDIFALYNEVINGLRLVAKRQIEIQSIGIDTWGVDFVCVGSDGAILRNPLAYRDPHTVGKMEEYFEKKVTRDEVYNITGIQFMNFNSLFQLYAMDEAGNTALRNADKVLFVPDALSYMLTGNAVCEYTIASTSQMLDPRTKDLDSRLVESVGLKRGQFGEMVNPATVIGTITEEVQKMTGLGAVPVIAVAGHDTGSAVAAVPAANEKFAYLSSGTWSLMGIETQDAIINARSFDLNFTNEGGIEGTTRFLKNICGMWIYERCRKEWKDAEGLGHAELQSAAMECEPFRSLINPDDPIFANPASMVDAITTYCEKTNQPIPQGYAQTCRCIFDSLALRYRQVFAWLKEFADFDINVLHIIGGGSKNEYLDQFTANSCGVTVLAGPQEGTAIGNIMLQAKAAGMVGDIWEMRRIIADSLELKRFDPQDKEIWDAAYEKYLDIVNLKG